MPLSSDVRKMHIYWFQRAFACLILALTLSGCLGSEEQIFPSSSSDDLPGITGHWVNPDQNLDLFVRRNTDGSFSAKPDLTATDEMRGNGIPLGNGNFLMQQLGSGGFGLYLVQVLPKHLVVFTLTNERIRAGGTKFGIPLKEGNTGPYLAAGADPKKVLAWFQELAKDPDYQHTLAYQRAGGFVEKGGEANTIASLDNALDSNDVAAILRIGRYLADRGCAEAQYKLANAFSKQSFNAPLGIQYGLDAFASGYTGVEPLLAMLYRARGDGTIAPAGAPSNPDYEHSLYWVGMSIWNGVDLQNARRVLTTWAKDSCIAKGISDPQKIDACAVGTALYATESSKTKAIIVAHSEALIQNILAQAAITKRNEQTQAEIQALEEEKSALLAKKAILEGKHAPRKK